MKFKDVNFKDKQKFRGYVITEIFLRLEHKLPCRWLSRGLIYRYLNILIDECDFNPYTKVFYDPDSHSKFNYDFLAEVARGYIQEHVDDFILFNVKD